MELNAEINKVFGEEMAKLFAAKFSEEEMERYANVAWKSLIQKSNTYWENESEIDKAVKRAMLDKMQEKIKEVTGTEEFQNNMSALAKIIVDEIIDETHKKMVESVSTQLAMLSTGYSGYGLNSLIEETVTRMMKS